MCGSLTSWVVSVCVACSGTECLCPCTCVCSSCVCACVPLQTVCVCLTPCFCMVRRCVPVRRVEMEGRLLPEDESSHIEGGSAFSEGLPSLDPATPGRDRRRQGRQLPPHPHPVSVYNDRPPHRPADSRSPPSPPWEHSPRTRGTEPGEEPGAASRSGGGPLARVVGHTHLGADATHRTWQATLRLHDAGRSAVPLPHPGTLSRSEAKTRD